MNVFLFLSYTSFKKQKQIKTTKKNAFNGKKIDVYLETRRRMSISGKYGLIWPYPSDTVGRCIQVHTDSCSRLSGLCSYRRSDRGHWHTRLYLEEIDQCSNWWKATANRYSNTGLQMCVCACVRTGMRVRVCVFLSKTTYQPRILSVRTYQLTVTSLIKNSFSPVWHCGSV